MPDVAPDIVSPIPPMPPDAEVLQSNVHLAECLLWDLQEAYYLEKGVDAWEKVPYYITNNTFIAETYADLIISLLLDLREQLDVTKPLYIVEIAAGFGCLSFYLVREIAAKRQHYSCLRDLQIRYVVTDFAEANLEYLQGTEQLKALAEAGLLDFALYRPDSQSSMELRGSGETLSAETLANPVIAVANYFFDSIRQDMFQTREGRLQEMLLTFYRAPEEPDGPISFNNVRYAADYKDVQDYFADPVMNQILQYYADKLVDSCILFPVAGLDSIRHLLELTGRNLVLLSSDKGFTDNAYMWGSVDHPYSVQGSLSFMVNYDAITRYFELQGGRAFNTTATDLQVVTSLACLVRRANPLEHTAYCFHQKIERLNPINYLYRSQQLIDSGGCNDPNELMLALTSYLYMSNHDPVAFGRCADWIFKNIAGMHEDAHKRLRLLMDQVFDNFYPMENQADATLWLGMMYQVLEKPDKALTCYRRGRALWVKEPATHLHLGNALESLGVYDEAADAFATYLELVPGADDAAEVRARVEELRRLGAAAAT